MDVWEGKEMSSKQKWMKWEGICRQETEKNGRNKEREMIKSWT